MGRQAKVTSKGQVTIPREIRRRLGVRTGDRLLFEGDGNAVKITAVRNESPFEKYRGIGTPGIAKNRKGIQKWLRALRGQ
ncbi:MAG TPA: AbrB/MazE/SpoVT family DNA-binding domain-containing protein [Candidatus Acidoferrum sp.]|nr:AbrB/MazE/SpoVT family DNA-binding domain-containing protein [Candidatus Acidoferrum sp.]